MLYDPEVFQAGSEYYNEKDDTPPRCRSCGSTNINFDVYESGRFWVCLDCGRQSGMEAAYDEENAIPAPHNDPFLRESLGFDP